jgi:hypothetical protein
MPVCVPDEWTIQPGFVDFGVSIHPEDANELIVLISQHKSFTRRNKTLRQRGTHIRFAFAKEADVMRAVAVETGYKVDKFFKMIFAGKNVYHFIK